MKNWSSAAEPVHKGMGTLGKIGFSDAAAKSRA
jgi:hypothetical protein